MKKNYFLLAISLFIFTTAFSQRAGLGPGVSLARASYEPSTGIDRRFFAGFDGGIAVEFPVKDKFYLQPEFNFAIIGVELNNGITEYTIKLSYFTVPLLLKYNAMDKLSVFAGPQLGFLLKARSDPSDQSASTDIFDSFKKFDFVVPVGLEYKISSSLSLGLRYNFGLSNVAEEFSNFEMKNQWASARLIFYFGGANKN